MSSLDRFKTAQASSDSGFETALSELQAGRKTSHWIWYVFPQLEELGRSSTAKFYGIRDLGEACEYLRDSILRGRLIAVTEAVAAQVKRGNLVSHLMGGPTDSLKLVSSLTLFRAAAAKLNNPELANFAAQCEEILTTADRQGFPQCSLTLGCVGELRGNTGV